MTVVAALVLTVDGVCSSGFIELFTLNLLFAFPRIFLLLPQEQVRRLELSVRREMLQICTGVDRRGKILESGRSGFKCQLFYFLHL